MRNRTASGGAFAPLARFTVERPKIVLAVALAWTLLAAALLPRLSIEPDISRLLPADHPDVELAAMVEERTQSRRSLLVFLRGDGMADRLARVVESLRASPFLERVAATRSEFAASGATAARDAPLWFLDLAQLDRIERRLLRAGRTAALRETRQQLAEDPIGSREIAVRDPLGLRWLWSEAALQLPLEFAPGTPFLVLADERRAFVMVYGRKTAFDTEYATQLIREIESRVRELEPDWQTQLVGGYAVASADAARIRGDLQMSTIGSALLIAVFLTLSMRSFFRPLLIFAPVLLAAFWALPIGSAWFGPLTPLAIAAAAVLFGLGVDFSIHYLVHYAEERAHHEHAPAVERAHRASGTPISIGMATTAGAFLSLAFGHFSGLRSFACLLGLGLVLALFATLVVLPVLLSKAPRIGPTFARSRIVDALDRLAASRHGTTIAWTILAVALAAAVVLATRGLEVTVDADRIRPADDPVAATRAHLEHELGFSTIPVVVVPHRDANRNGIARGLSQLLENRVLALIPDRGRLIDDARRERVATLRRRTVGWRQAIDEDLRTLGFSTEPFSETLDDLAAKITAPEPAAEIGEAIIAFPPRRLDAASWQDFATRVRRACGSETRVFGTPSLNAELRRILTGDLVQASWITALLAFLLVAIVVRSLRAGLLALIPAACGFSITLCVLSLGGIPLTIANFFAIPLLLGIGVDDGVHLVMHLRRGHALSSQTGVAIMRTSVTTMLAFGSLQTVESPGLASMGMIVVVGVGTCFLTTLCVLPPLAGQLGSFGSHCDSSDKRR